MIHFKHASLHDAPTIVTLVNSAYRGDSSKVGWTTEADILGGQRTDLAKIQEMISDPYALIELALNEREELLGCVYLSFERSMMYLGMLTVNPNLQAQGLGKEILLRTEEIAKSKKATSIRMTVISLREELIAFYERRGYRKTGKTEPFPAQDPRFGLPKTEGLIFIELMKNLNE